MATKKSAGEQEMVTEQEPAQEQVTEPVKATKPATKSKAKAKSKATKSKAKSKATGKQQKAKSKAKSKAKKRKEKKEVNRVRGALIEAIKAAGANGLHSYDLAEITGQTSEKLARQALRKARWDIAELGFRLAASKERDEGRYKVYRLVKIQKGVPTTQVEKKLEVTFYPLKTA